MNIISSPAAAYLRSHHPDLPLAVGLGLCGCSTKLPTETIRECLPDVSDEMACGILSNFKEIYTQESCACAYLIDSGVTIQHHADALVALEAELVDCVGATFAVDNHEDLRRLVDALLRGDSVRFSRQMHLRLTHVEEKVRTISKRIEVVISSLHGLTESRACLHLAREKESTCSVLAGMLEQVALEQVVFEYEIGEEDTPEEPVDGVEEGAGEPAEASAEV